MINYYIVVIMIILSFFQIIFSCLSPESPRFLYSVGKYKEMNESLSYIAKINGATYTKDANIEDNKSRSDSNETQIVGFLDSIRNDSVYRKNLFIMAFNWWVCSIACYITLFYVGMYPGNLYINAMMLFVGDTISTSLSSTFVNYFGFTKGFNIAFISIFATSLVIEIFNNYPEITYLWVLLIRIGIILWFTMVYLSQSEYFKPNISARSFAFCNVLSRVLTILSPVIVSTVPHSILIITVLTFIASISSKYLEKQ